MKQTPVLHPVLPKENAPTFTVWTCSICGTGYPYQDHPPKFGGPRARGLDRRYGFLASCWRTRSTQCKSHRLTNHGIVLLSPVAPNPEQPEQDMTDIQFGPKKKEKKP